MTTEPKHRAARRPPDRPAAEGARRQPLFTLSGGHLFSLYDGCRAEGIDLVDVRHEQTAAFAAEGWAKVTREPGVVRAHRRAGRDQRDERARRSAQQSHSPMLVLGGRAPALRWGQGSLQEIDHVPFVRPLVKLAATAGSTAEIPGLVDEALAPAARPARRAGVPRLPARRRVLRGRRAGARAAPRRRARRAPTARALERAAALLRDAERPVIMAGTDLYWGRAEGELRALAEALGDARLPQRPRARLRARRPPAVLLPRPRGGAGGRRRRARGRRADGLPARLRRRRSGPRPRSSCSTSPSPSASIRGRSRPSSTATCRDARGAARAAGRGQPDTRLGRRTCAAMEDEQARGRARAARGRAQPAASPARLQGARRGARPRRDRDLRRRRLRLLRRAAAIDSYEPGCWLDPGPFGCLGCGPGYALAAKLAHPGRQVVLLLGDGAFGFAGMEWDTLARHGVAVVGVMGNNGIWGLEKHPMEASTATRWSPTCARGRATTRSSRRSAPAASSSASRPSCARRSSGRSPSGEPTLVNVLTDPAVAYPRTSNLA